MSYEIDFSTDRPIAGKDLLTENTSIARACWVARHIRSDSVYFLQDGTFSQLLLEETLEAYIAGHTIAVIVLGFSLIERTIAGRLAFIGAAKEASSMSEALLRIAVDKHWLTLDEKNHLDTIRALRNPVVHFREHLDDRRPEVRAALNAKTTQQLLEDDARLVMEALMSVLTKVAL